MEAIIRSLRGPKFLWAVIGYVLLPFFTLLPGIQASASLPPELEARLMSYFEKMTDEGEDIPDYESLLLELSALAASPLSLNRASAGELRRLPFLNEMMIQNLLQHIHRYGPLHSISELQLIDGFSPELIRLAGHFLTTENTAGFPALLKDGAAMHARHQLSLRLGKQSNYSHHYHEQRPFPENTNSHYMGDPYRISLVYNLRYFRKFRAGFRAGKDPGEPWYARGKTHGFDFYSGHVMLRDVGMIKTLVLGDYQAGFGQGMLLWTSFSPGKGSDVLQVRKNAGGIRPHTSGNENHFFRGIGLTLERRRMEFSLLLSSKARDASIQNPDSSGQRFFSSLRDSGLHRPDSEMAGKNALKEGMIATRMAYNGRGLQAGVMQLHHWFDAGYQPANPLTPAFPGLQKQNTGYAADIGIGVKNTGLFAELASYGKSKTAFVAGMLMGIGPGIIFSGLLRSYDQQYHGYYSCPFGEQTRANNEKGIYSGIQLSLTNHIRLSAYADFFRHPWIRYRMGMPAEGSDYLILFSVNKPGLPDWHVRYRLKTKPGNATGSTHLPLLAAHSRQTLRFHINTALSREWELKNRIEWVRSISNGQNSQGYMMYQDLSWNARGRPVTFRLRYTLYHTTDYEARVYAFESNLFSAFSYPALSGQGLRLHGHIRYRLNNALSCYFQFSGNYRTDDGPDSGTIYKSEGSSRWEYRSMLRWQF